MAWCPKCKNEYRDGITVCADCGCALVEEAGGTSVNLIFGDENQMKALKEFLEYNQIQSAQLSFDESEEVYELKVAETDQKSAVALARIFLQQEALKAQGEQESTDRGTKAPEPVAGLYRSSSERAEDNRSSAWILLVVGGIGLLVMILGATEVLPFGIGNPYLFYGVMSAVFLLFLVMGMVSMKNARIFEKKAESENSLREVVTAWCRENLDAASIDAGLEEIAQLPEEMRYLQRCELMKKKLNHQFLNLDQGFVDHFIDNEVYDMVFGESGGSDIS